MNHLGENLIDVQMSVLKTLERFIKNSVVLGMIHNPMVHNLTIHNSCVMHKLSFFACHEQIGARENSLHYIENFTG